MRRGLGHALRILLLIVSGCQTKGRPREPLLIPPGALHEREVTIDGKKFRVELQFYRVPYGLACWNAVGRDRAGNVYVAFSTWETNAYLYRLDAATRELHYLGDTFAHVRYASPGAGDNGKIHSSFTEGSDGNIYYTSHFSDMQNIRYGGHLWRYDPRNGRITDLGVPLPGNSSFCLTEVNPHRPLAYMLSTPAGIMIEYNFATGGFRAVEKTDMGGVRNMPMDMDGTLYALGEDTIRKFDPRVGRWQVVAKHKPPRMEEGFSAMSAYVWTADRREMYFAAYKTGALFRWRVGSPDVEPLSKMHPDGTDLYFHTLHLNDRDTRLFTMASTDNVGNKGLYMLDLPSKRRCKLVALEDIIEHETGGKLRGETARVWFADYGGVIGDDGTMYTSLQCYGRDKERCPEGLHFGALVTIRVFEDGQALKPAPQERLPVPAFDLGAEKPTPFATIPLPAPGSDGLVTNVGLVEDYRMAEKGGPVDEQGHLPLAYWVRLSEAKDVPGSVPALLYVHVAENEPDPSNRFETAREIANVLPKARTAHDPRFDRYLVAGRRLRYTGRAVQANGRDPAHIDTAVPGGKVEIVFDAMPVRELNDLAVGRTVVFEGLVEPRKAWLEDFEGVGYRQTWQLVVTLPSGETVEIGDRLLVESHDFLRCLSLMREKEAVNVRVVGQVADAEPYRRPVDKRGIPPRDVTGKVLVLVEQLEILGHHPAEVRP